MALLYKQIEVPKNNAVVDNNTAKNFTYRGFSTIPATANLTRPDSLTLYDAALVKRDLLNHFIIRRGEKLDNPAFGTIIWDLLFGQLTERVKSQIVDDVTNIVNYDPRTQMTSVVVNEEQNGITISIELVYLPFNISESLLVDFTKEM